MEDKNTYSLCKLIRNEDGIALVTSLMLTLISLGIIMSLLYLITSSIQRTGANKRYRSALEASYGASEIITKDLFPIVLQNTTLSNTQFVALLQSTYGATINTLSPQQATCLQAKLASTTASWPSACGAELSPKAQPDFQISLSGTNNTSFTVYSKIVDTMTGNTDMTGLQLGGSGVAESQSVLAPQHFPYVYRLEVQAERSVNALEKSNLSVLYAY